jgi:RNA polymerase sigma-70 factor (ECF subfamily)
VAEPSDAELVRRSVDGDRDAFAILVRRHERRVYSVAFRMLGRQEDASDASQDAFLTAFRYLDRFRGEAAFSTWLHRITVNACYDMLRKRTREPLLHASPADGSPEPEPGSPLPDHAERVAQALDAQEALARVPEEFRAALVLADVEDLPYEEIAAILQIAVGTVKSRVHRGRLALARALGRGEPVGPGSASEEER